MDQESQGDREPNPDLDWYRNTGHLVLGGHLGDVPTTVLITPYAQEWMTLRDIDPKEVLEVLARPRSTHGSGRILGRREVAGDTDRGHIRVVYKPLTSEVVLVITVHSE